MDKNSIYSSSVNAPLKMEVDMLKAAGFSLEDIKSLITDKIKADKETEALKIQADKETEALKIQADKETKALEIEADKEAKIKIELAKINASKSQVIYIFLLIKIINISCILLTMFLYLLKSDMELSAFNAILASLSSFVGTLNVFPNKSYNAAICAIAAASLTYAFVWLRACLISLRTQEPETEPESQGLLEGAR